jgi:hypothetical protein
MLATTERETVTTLGNVQVKITVPKKIVNGVVLYGQALARDGGRFYPMAKRRIGAGRFNYRCGCPANVLGVRICIHIAAFIVSERQQKGV